MINQNLGLVTSHTVTHTPMEQPGSNLGVSILTKDTLTCSLAIAPQPHHHWVSAKLIHHCTKDHHIILQAFFLKAAHDNVPQTWKHPYLGNSVLRRPEETLAPHLKLHSFLEISIHRCVSVGWTECVTIYTISLPHIRVCMYMLVHVTNNNELEVHWGPQQMLTVPLQRQGGDAGHLDVMMYLIRFC